MAQNGPLEADAERALVARCRSGDEDAFRRLVDAYKALVYGLIVRTVQDRAAADDLAQEVFLRVYRGLPYFRGASRLSTWIYRITANVCLEGRQRAAARWVEAPLDEVATDPGGLDGRFDEVLLRDALEKALARLPPESRFLIAAHYLDGVRYEDLAAALGVPLGTLKAQLHRAKRRLRLMLEEPRR